MGIRNFCSERRGAFACSRSFFFDIFRSRVPPLFRGCFFLFSGSGHRSPSDAPFSSRAASSESLARSSSAFFLVAVTPSTFLWTLIAKFFSSARVPRSERRSFWWPSSFPPPPFSRSLRDTVSFLFVGGALPTVTPAFPSAATSLISFLIPDTCGRGCESFSSPQFPPLRPASDCRRSPLWLDYLIRARCRRIWSGRNGFAEASLISQTT